MTTKPTVKKTTAKPKIQLEQTLKGTLATLRKENQGLKILNGKLKKKVNGHADYDPNELTQAELRADLEVKKFDLGKSEAEVERLQKILQRFDVAEGEDPKADLEINDLRDQIYHMQQLIIHTAAVTEWKIQ